MANTPSKAHLITKPDRLAYTCGNKSEDGIKALAAIKKLKETSQVDPILIRGFNQNGTWSFIDKLEALTPSKDEYIFLANYKLPKEKRTRTDKDGNTHLLTNFIHTEQKEDLSIPYKSIDGRLIIKNVLYVKANQLEKINGTVRLERTKSLKAPKLKEVNGNLNATMLTSLDAESLTKINGELNIFYAHSAILTNLKEVKSLKLANLEPEKQKKIVRNLSLESLTTILASPPMSPRATSTNGVALRTLIEKAIKEKTLTGKVIKHNDQQILEL